MAVDRMQWGAEAWQYADLYMPDDPSPFQKDEGIPCIMLIHGGFWKFGRSFCCLPTRDDGNCGLLACLR